MTATAVSSVNQVLDARLVQDGRQLVVVEEVDHRVLQKQRIGPKDIDVIFFIDNFILILVLMYL